MMTKRALSGRSGHARLAQCRTFRAWRKQGCASSSRRYGAAHQMSDQISWYVELAVKPSQLDNFQALTGEMVEATRRERGVLAYQRFVSADCKLASSMSGMQTRLRRWHICEGSRSTSRGDSRKWWIEHASPYSVIQAMS